MDPDPFEGEISSLYASYNYSAALTPSGLIYTWGSGEFGRLGYVDTKK